MLSTRLATARSVIHRFRPRAVDSASGCGDSTHVRAASTASADHLLARPDHRLGGRHAGGSSSDPAGPGRLAGRGPGPGGRRLRPTGDALGSRPSRSRSRREPRRSGAGGRRGNSALRRSGRRQAGRLHRPRWGPDDVRTGASDGARGSAGGDGSTDRAGLERRPLRTPLPSLGTSGRHELSQSIAADPRGRRSVAARRRGPPRRRGPRGSGTGRGRRDCRRGRDLRRPGRAGWQSRLHPSGARRHHLPLWDAVPPGPQALEVA